MDRERIERTTVVKRSNEPVAVEVDGSLVMMSILRGNYYGLDKIGSRVWDLLEEPRSVDSLCGILESEFDVDRATCETDVLEFVRELSSEGLVDVVRTTAA